MKEKIVEYGNEKDLFYFSRMKRSSPVNMAHNHFHSSYELYYLVSGERYYFIKDKTFQVMEKDLVLIKRGDLHKTASSGELEHERILINFREGYINPGAEDPDKLLLPFEKDINIIRFTMAEQMELERLLNSIQDELIIRGHLYEVNVQALFIQLLVYISRHVKRYGAVKYFRQPSVMHKKVSDIVQYINMNYMESLTLKSIAKRFNMSPSYLSRVFKRATGFTLTEYINNVRIKEAQALLLSTDYKVIDISAKVGYTNTSHFGRVFR
ncbi:MAG: AraC family transcriptional regulator, partial [Clostridiales bacterium]|nr:AraC family transcriptional regulator [Clostridiales bacterium]